MTTETTPAQTQTADVTSPIVTTDVQPTVTSPVVEGTDPNATPAEPAVESAPVDNGTDPATGAPKQTPEWAQKRINELTAKRYEAERTAKEAERTAKSERDARVAAEARAAELLSQIAGKTTTEPTTTKPALSEEEIDKLATERAKLIAQANEFNKTCNEIVETGKKEFPKDWDEALSNLSLVGAIGQGVSPEFLETVTELKNPAKILHHLGMNIEEADRIAKLPPKKMAVEMARVEARLNAPAPAQAPAPVSNAPAPVIPVGGVAKAGTPSLDDPNLTTEEFMALRNKQSEERRNRYRRV